MGQGTGGRLCSVLVPKCRGNLVDQDAQDLDDRVRVVVESHLDLVAQRWFSATHLVGLPQRGDLGGDGFGSRGRFCVGQWEAIEALEFGWRVFSVEQNSA